MKRKRELEFRGKSVLITGGLGFIGSNLAVRLVKEHGADVTLLTKSTSKIRNIAEIKNKVKVIEGDVADYDLLKKVVVSVDYIFHLAAQTSNIRSMESPLEDLQANARGTLSVLEACRRCDISCSVVSVGSVTQIGKALRLPVQEDHPTNPSTIYDAHKLTCEYYFGIYYRRFKLRTSFLRLSTVFGERQDLYGTRTGIVNSFIGRALRGKPIQVFGDGEFVRDFVYVGNVADALLAAAVSSAAYGNFYQVTTGRAVKFIEMVNAVISTVERLTGKKSMVEFAPWPKEWQQVDYGSFVGSHDRLTRDTGWTPRVSLEEGIERTVRFYLEH